VQGAGSDDGGGGGVGDGRAGKKRRWLGTGDCEG